MFDARWKSVYAKYAIQVVICSEILSTELQAKPGFILNFRQGGPNMIIAELRGEVRGM